MTYSTITQKWQVTLPKEIRTFLGLEKPGRVLLEVDRKKKLLKIESAPDILSLAGKFKAKKTINALKIREIMEHDYQRI